MKNHKKEKEAIEEMGPMKPSQGLGGLGDSGLGDIGLTKSASARIFQRTSLFFDKKNRKSQSLVFDLS